MQNCAGSSKLCGKVRKTTDCADMYICAGNGLKCENVRETAKSSIPHTLHFILTSEKHWKAVFICFMQVKLTLLL